MKGLFAALTSIGLTTIASIASGQVPSPPPIFQNGNDWGSLIASVSGFYFEPSVNNGDLDYATLRTVADDEEVGGAFFSRQLHFDPDYSWEWGASLGYVFPQTANDITASYFHFGQRESVVKLNEDNAFFFPVNFVDLVGLGLFLNLVISQVDFDMDEVTLTAGQSINLGNRLLIHPFAGAEYNNLKRQLNTSFYPSLEDSVAAQEEIINIQESSDFKGIGPTAGMDLSYYFGGNLGLVAHLNSALLIGTIESKNGFAAVNLNIDDAPPLRVFFEGRSLYRIVPEVGAKLGANYSYLFPNQHTNLSLEAGYQVNHYFNILDRLQTGVAFQIQSESTGGQLLGHKTASFGIQGPYVSLILRT